MSSENSVSELEAKFDAILGQILARRGKRRQKHVAELKQLFLTNVNQDRLSAVQENRAKHEKLQAQLVETKIKLSAVQLSFTASEDMRNQIYSQIDKLEGKLDDTQQKLHNSQVANKLLQNQMKTIKAVVTSWSN